MFVSQVDSERGRAFQRRQKAIHWARVLSMQGSCVFELEIAPRKGAFRIAVHRGERGLTGEMK
jgi:hypothetical protein